MKPIPMNQQKNRGFALIEVMVAALVLTVGCLAFLKLQRLGIQYAFNDYARSQGVAIAQGFTEKLRSNTPFVNAADLQYGDIKSNASLSGTLPQENANCEADTPGIACAKALLDYHRYLTAQQMKTFIKGKSKLCYRKHPSIKGSLRLTFMWVDNSSTQKAKETFDSIECPESFTAQLGEDIIDSSVTIYAQL